METDRTGGREPQPGSAESDGFSVSDVLFRHIEQRGNQCVWMLDLDGNTVYVNDGLAEMLAIPLRK